MVVEAIAFAVAAVGVFAALGAGLGLFCGIAARVADFVTGSRW
jgi:hypothetical protein